MRLIPIIFYLFTGLYSLAQSNEKLYALTLENFESKKYKKALSNIEKVIKKDNQEKYILTKINVLLLLNTPYKEILTFLNQQITESPSPSLLIERRSGYQAIYRFQDAILDYSQAIKSAKENSILVKFLDCRGSLYQKIRTPKLSKIDYERAYKIDSNSYSVCNNFSIVLDDLGEFKRAKYLLLKLVEKDSTSFHALMNLVFLPHSMKNMMKL